MSAESTLRSDFAKVDARRVTQADYEEIPELGDEFLQGGEHRAGALAKRGCGWRLGLKKAQMNLRIDID